MSDVRDGGGEERLAGMGSGLFAKWLSVSFTHNVTLGKDLKLRELQVTEHSRCKDQLRPGAGGDPEQGREWD